MKHKPIIIVLSLIIIVLIAIAVNLNGVNMKAEPLASIPGLPQTGALPYPLMKISHHDMAPDDLFPNLEKAATFTIAASGRWSDIFLGQEPKPSDLILIPQGVSVEYDASSAASFTAVIVRGDLHFSTAQSTKMTVGTIMVYPGGTLTIKPDNASITSEIVISGVVDTMMDPTQTAQGLVAVGGTVTIVGTPVSPAFTYSASQITSPIRHDPTDWMYHGNTARTLSFPLTREQALSETGYSVNTARNVIIRSAALATKERGNIIFTAMTSATVKNTAIIGMGRTTVESTDDASFSASGAPLHIGTNQRGRYALHAHHLEMPFVFDGNVIDGSPKWGIVNHASFGSITNNIVMGAAGAGIVCEDGIESGLVANNLVVGTGGGSGQSDDERFGVTGGKDMAHGGFGFWFRGPFVDIRDNVAVGYFPEGGFTLFFHPSFVHTMMPEIQGMPAELYGKMMPDLVARSPIRLFSGNKTAGYFGDAALSIFYTLVPQNIDRLDLTIFGTSYARGIFLRHSYTLLVKDSTLRGGGLGPALESSASVGPITPVNTVVTGFK